MTRARRQSFQEIAALKTEGFDYKINVLDRVSAIVIIAPHGGDIEPGSSEIAAAIAGVDLSLYDFRGLRNTSGHGELHLPSHKFDEPRCLRLVEAAETVVAIHGRKNGDDAERVWIGGLDVQRCRRTMTELTKAGFGAVVREPGETLAGTAVSNICNRGKRKMGIQLEIPKALRKQLKDDSRATDNVRGASVEAEPVYMSRVGTPLTAEVEALCFVDEDAATKFQLL
ncbi:DUF867-domain-containing protein [Aureobasidium namibiae CBS 147.97]|uniref:DUF867-domain-containing protein n=1 Tax=Aureobasidium namibiae CBS 147.97 TaxID=1043004 RepID=A0A074WPW6_9PEZI|nr:DUF867-domain-containing protein [Aureobasidium namibiae CBS 147.97]KEQ75168.1 DUF867-domain-containing protein [Aureobasidium namibiae CBS 147.97]